MIVLGSIANFLGRLRQRQSRLGVDVTVDHKDLSRPIDILFYGYQNPHREKVRKMFEKLAEENDLHIRFYLNYTAFGLVKETLIDQAKVSRTFLVLSLMIHSSDCA